MIACKATTRSGQACPTGATYVDAEGGTWCHEPTPKADE